jgi:serine/threonine protein kinase
MDDRESEATRLAWLLPYTLSLTAILAESLISQLSPLVAPQICAAALGLQLPRRKFLVLIALLAVAIVLPLVAHADDGRQWSHRGIGLACLIAIAATRSRFSLLNQLRQFRDTTQSRISKSVTASPLTQVHDTAHRNQDTPDEEFRIDDGHGDYIAPIIDRLRSGGMFDKRQMELIETEMRVLENQSIALNHASLLQQGVRIGRFIIDQPLGRGGEGSVYRAHDESAKPAAIKILHNMRVGDRFRREMHMVRQLAHPNIVTAYEVGEFRGLPFITMELLKGPDLNLLIHDSGPLDWQVSTKYVLQAVRALSHAHRRDLIHRDIKPGNFILHGDVVKLVDLGLAAMCGNDATLDSVFQFETQEGHLAGTLPYMAPEQARSLANATVQSDIYGIGATWFYLLTGKARLRGKTFAQQFENLLVRRRFNALPDDCLPPALVEIYQRMVAYRVEKRCDSCETLTTDIEQALETAGQSVGVEGIQVLVVEDSRTDMMFTIEMLRRTNPSLEIHKAKTLSEGLDIWRRMSIDLVLLDLTLPDSAGVATVCRFRDAAKDVPLVVLTGMSQDEAGAACLEAGADTFVSKNGLTAHRMERTIFVALSRWGLPREEADPQEP